MKYNDLGEKQGYLRQLYKDKSEEYLKETTAFSKSPRDKQIERSSSAIGHNNMHLENYYLTGWGNPKYGQLGSNIQQRCQIT